MEEVDPLPFELQAFRDRQVRQPLLIRLSQEGVGVREGPMHDLLLVARRLVARLGVAGERMLVVAPDRHQRPQRAEHLKAFLRLRPPHDDIAQADDDVGCLLAKILDHCFKGDGVAVHVRDRCDAQG